MLDHLLIDGFHVGKIAENGQPDLLSLEDASMCDLNSRLQRLSFTRFKQLTMDGASFIVHILSAIQRICEHISNYFNSPLDVLPEDGHHV